MSSWPVSGGDPSPLAYTLGTGFKNLSSAPPFIQLHAIIGHIKETTLGWYRYQTSMLDAPLLHQIVEARTCVVHDLLCLPDLSNDIQSREECLYELCRLGTLSYMLIFLYPLSMSHGPHEQLANRLMVMLDIAFPLGLWATDTNFMQWVTVIGGITAKDTPLCRWYAKQLSKFGTLRALGTWPRFSSVLTNYLWLNSECDTDGMEFWQESMALNQSSLAAFQRDG